MTKKPEPQKIEIGKSYLYRGRPINLVEQMPDGVICVRLDDPKARPFTLRWDQFGGLGEEVANG